MDTEPRLVRALSRRDRTVWAAMYDRHVGAVFGLVYHLVGQDRAVAEDVNQEVWLLAIEQVDSFDAARGEFRDWLLGIARHRALRRRRDPARYFESRSDAPSDALAPLELLEGAERADMVRAALICLHDDWRAVLLDKYAEGLSVTEIADRTGRSAKAVESVLSRAREQLRALLRPYFSNPTGGYPHAPSNARPAR
jgi:RNA polymerase sigma-70 factor (ECF subfamily)